MKEISIQIPVNLLECCFPITEEKEITIKSNEGHVEELILKRLGDFFG
jgi:hypothetical protein